MQRQIKVDGRQVNYQCEGNGPAVVLLHGFGETSAIWEFQKVLAQHFKLLIPDLPGSGASESISDMSIEGLAETISTLLQNEAIEKCTLIGHSMGGYVALAFAEKYEHKLSGLGLFHSTAFADTDEKIATRKKGINFIKEHGAATFLKTTLPNLYSPATKANHPALIEQQLQGVNDFSNEALIGYYEAMIKRPDRTDVLRRVSIPVLFMLGRHDAAVPLQAGFAQCALPQIAYIHVLENSGHMGMVEEPEASQILLQQFFSET